MLDSIKIIQYLAVAEGKGDVLDFIEAGESGDSDDEDYERWSDQADALLPLIEAERRAASNETAKAIRDGILEVSKSHPLVNTLYLAADIAAAHIKQTGK